MKVNFIEERQERWQNGDKRGRYLSNKLRGLLLEIREYYGLSRHTRKGTGYLVRRCLDEALLMKRVGDTSIGCNRALSEDNFLRDWGLRNATTDAISVLMDEPYKERRKILELVGPHNRKALLVDLARITKLTPGELVSISKPVIDEYSANELKEYATVLAVQKLMGVK